MNKVIEIIDSDDDTQMPTSTSNNTLLNNNMETDDIQQNQSRRRRRKSVLHAMTDPDMQFQTISLEDDEDDVDANNCKTLNVIQNLPVKIPPVAASASRVPLKHQRIPPKILTPKAPTNEEIVETHMEKFINDPETINDMHAIAEERTRINYLLVLNGMPEMKFSLYTRPERLHLQLEERLKQRKMVKNRDNARLENRRNLLQKNGELNNTL